MNQQSMVSKFLIRLIANALGLWVASSLLAGSISYGDRFAAVVIAGAVLALVNAVIKPIIVILSLPAILFSLGLFMVIINGLMISIASWLYKPLQVDNFGAAILAGIIIGLLNYVVTTILEDKS